MGTKVRRWLLIGLRTRPRVWARHTSLVLSESIALGIYFPALAGDGRPIPDGSRYPPPLATPRRGLS